MIDPRGFDDLYKRGRVAQVVDNVGQGGHDGRGVRCHSRALQQTIGVLAIEWLEQLLSLGMSFEQPVGDAVRS